MEQLYVRGGRRLDAEGPGTSYLSPEEAWFRGVIDAGGKNERHPRSVSGRTPKALRCLDHGARTYLVKPFDLDFLERCVRDALITRRLLIERNRLSD